MAREEDPTALFVQYLQAQDLNVTSTRKRIAEEIFKLNEHFDATTLWSKLREDTSISMSTIYRTLDLLLDAGLLKEVDFGESHTKYEHTLDEENEHVHLICLNCGTVKEVSASKINSIIIEEVQETDFEYEFSKIQVFGYCNNCK